MKRSTISGLSALLLLIAFICGWGYLSSFEPTDPPGAFVPFKISYAIVGLGSLTGIVVLTVMGMRGR
jgi:hypothetical protein